MPRKQPRLAKLTRPRLHRAVARERLFDLLDGMRQHPVIWTAGPPGAGKTTLASTWLETTKLPCIWFQMDSGDADPATFFYYLRTAASALLTGTKPLPLLTAEYLSDIDAFARRFMRELFRRAPRETVLVLDNYHEVAAGSRLHAALAAGIEEVPEGSNIIVLSRADPPPEYARARLAQIITSIDWETLRLTRQETALIASSRAKLEPAVVDLLYEQTAGWTGGVVLLLERLRRDGVLYPDGPGATSGAAFDYFASQIFDPSPPETRDLLLSAALLSEITVPLLEELTGNRNTRLVLESFYQRHLFIDRRPGNPPNYRLHALFREFLLHRARTDLDASDLCALQGRAAQILLRLGREEEAIALLLAAEDWLRAEQLLIEAAPALIRQGRWWTLQDWTQALPAERVSASPWLQYWLGRSTIAVEPTSAESMLEAAYSGFESSGDAIGQLLAAAGVLDALYFENHDFRAMEPWIARVVALLERGTRPANKEDELRVHAAVMTGAAYRAPQHSMCETCVRRVEILLSEPFDPNLKVTVAGMLHAYGNMAGDRRAEDFAIRIARPLLDAPDLTAGTAAFYLGREGYTHYIHGRYQNSLACFDRADPIAYDHGLRDLMVMLGNWRGLCERRAGLIGQADATIERIEHLGAPSRGMAGSIFQLLRASVAFARDDLEEAVSIIIDACRLAEKYGNFNGEILIKTVAAGFAISAGKIDVAAELLGYLRTQARGALAENYLGAIALNQAWLEHRHGNAARSIELLREALQLAHEERQRFRYRWYPNALSELLPIALERGIEPDIAQLLAREFDIPAPALPVEAWPWPVKVYCLGRFEVRLHDEAPRFSRKLPKKTLMLLKALIAFGTTDVAEAKLIDALWPDEDGDAAYRALTATVHRLRLLLGDRDAILQRGGALSLNGAKCWVDINYFEELLAWHDDSAAHEAAIRMYKGAFLAQEDEAPWAVPRRERARVKFIQAVADTAAGLEREGQFEQAARCYAQGVEVDDLIEIFYEGLMRCYARLGWHDDADRVYGRCRQTLHAKLGQKPSAAMDRLHRSLQELSVNGSQ